MLTPGVFSGRCPDAIIVTHKGQFLRIRRPRTRFRLGPGGGCGLVLIHRLVSPKTAADAVESLGLQAGVPVLVVVGGADGADPVALDAIDGTVREVLMPVVREVGAAVVDGGTDSGVMRALGRYRVGSDWGGPLVGVAVEALVGSDRGVELERHHTHAVLTPGQAWGDESATLADVASALATGRESVTVLLNGGTVSRGDVAHSLARGRAVVAFAATGRLAAELAHRSPAGVIPAHAGSDPEEHRALLRTLLGHGSPHQRAERRRTS
jgi:hypothetical protein